MNDGDGDVQGDGGGVTSEGETPSITDRDAAEVLDEAIDRPAASVGVLVAGLAFGGAFLPWTDGAPLVPPVADAGSTLAAVFAGIAATAFLVFRYGELDRRTAAATAGIGGAGVLLTALVRFIAPATGGGADPSVGVGLPLSGLGGALVVGLALAQARGATASTVAEMGRRTATGFGLVVGAFVLMAVVGAPLVGVEFDPMVAILVNVTIADVVFGTVAVAFLFVSGRGLGFVDLAVPDVRDLVYTGVGVVALFAVLIALRLVTLALELPTTTNNITNAAMEGHPETLLLLVVLSFVLVAPAEELLNRNVIQKYLYGPFTRTGAVVVASGIFAAAHVFSYGGDSVVGMFVSLTSIFLLSLVLGTIYERTENLVVPIFVHGFFNAAQFALLYVAIVSGAADQQPLVVLPL